MYYSNVPIASFGLDYYNKVGKSRQATNTTQHMNHSFKFLDGHFDEIKSSNFIISD